MASWKKHFSAIPSQLKIMKSDASDNRSSGAGSSAKYSSYLPEVYSGAPNRVERYTQYEQMDIDSEINKGLDIIADYSTQNYAPDELPFTIIFRQDMTETEVNMLNEMLGQWCSLNRWTQRLWRTFRNVIKYGDEIYIRDPETFKLIWINPNRVDKIIIDETKGKEIQQYVIRDLDFNLMTLVGTNVLIHDEYNYPSGYPRSTSNQSGSGPVNYGQVSTAGSSLSRFGLNNNQIAVDAAHVVHLSLSEGMDSQWPFGTSLLESIYKVYKQKDLLEDSILIYRIVRAPERRVFYVDTGSAQGARAQAMVDRMKNEIYQRRIPNRTGGGQSILDAAYNSIAINEDYFLPTNEEGKGSRIETLPGGDNLGQIDDLRYFNNKMIRGLGIPSSYLPTGPEDGTAVYTDGKVGTAYIQEFRFAKYCQRLQNLMVPELDREFKLYLKNRGIDIVSSSFELGMWEPQNFSQFKQTAVDAERISVFTSLMGTDAAKYISKRFAMLKYLGWDEADLLKNEEFFKQENAKKVKDKIGITATGSDSPGLSSVGIRPDANADTETSFDTDETDDTDDLGSSDQAPDTGTTEPPTET